MFEEVLNFLAFPPPEEAMTQTSGVLGGCDDFFTLHDHLL